MGFESLIVLPNILIFDYDCGQEREVDSQVPIGEPGTIGRLRVPRTLVVSIGCFSAPVD